MANIKLGIIPIIDVAPVKLGIEKGFFTEQRLTVTTQDAQGGAAIVPAVVSGQYQFGYSNVVSLMVARSKKMPLKVISIGARAGKNPLDDGAGQLMVKAAGITKVQDLAGKTIAVNTLRGINEVVVRSTLKAQGVDDTSIKLVEVPIPNMPAALESGQVHAAMMGEPFITIAARAGAHPLPISYAAMSASQPIAAWFTMESYAKGNADVVKRFKTALDKSLRYAEEHPDEARAVLDRYLKLPAGVSGEVTLPGWDPTINESELTRLADLSVELGIVPNRDALKELLN
jgi:NitT/TauT family transport system substrate-binding protein